MKLVIPCALLTLAGAACDDGGGEEEEEFTDGCDAPHYGGKATDEVWKVMVDTFDQAQIGAAEAVTITTPAADATLDGTTPVTFAWTSPIALAPRSPADVQAATATTAPGPLEWLAGGLDALGELVVGTAHAHLPPITSDVYYVVVTVPGRECPVRAVTTEESWKPTLAQWKILEAATGPLSMTVTSAYVTENVITEGPYRPAAATSFTVE